MVPSLRFSLAIAAMAALTRLDDSNAFAPSSRAAIRALPTKLRMVEQINLQEAIDNDHEAEGTRLAASITGWLDQEWMPQEVHVQMAESAKLSYITSRNSGQHNIADVLHRVADDLNENWSKFDKDAFVNAFDIANYVADYLHLRAGEDGCGCSATIFDPEAEASAS